MSRSHTIEKPEQFLASIDSDWQQHVDAIGPCLHQTKPQREPYEALIRAVAFQQLHAKAADVILSRLMALYPNQQFPTPKQLLATAIEQQRHCGFSARKLATIRSIAQATVDGLVPTRAQAVLLDDDALIKRLTSLHGVGRWTVEMFLIYTLERTDVLPADDFGIRHGYQRLKNLAETPTAAKMRMLGQAWHPYRTSAAWYLWRVPLS